MKVGNKENKLISALSDLKELFDKHDIDCWLICGALLGMVREGKMIKWDNDVDISVWEDNIGDIWKIKKEINNIGFSVHFTDSMHISFNRDDIYINVMIYKKNKDIAYRYTFTNFITYNLPEGFYESSLTQMTRGLKYIRWILMAPVYVGDPPRYVTRKLQKLLLNVSYMITGTIVQRIFIKFVERLLSVCCHYGMELLPVRFYKNLRPMDFYGIKINVPEDTIGYIEHMYGKDWRIPNENYEPDNKGLPEYMWKEIKVSESEPLRV